MNPADIVLAAAGVQGLESLCIVAQGHQLPITSAKNFLSPLTAALGGPVSTLKQLTLYGSFCTSVGGEKTGHASYNAATKASSNVTAADEHNAEDLLQPDMIRCGHLQAQLADPGNT